MIYSVPQSYLTDPQQMNSYAYARNNPVVYSDPTGLYSWNQFKSDVSSVVNKVINTVTNMVANSTPAIIGAVNGTTQIPQSVGTGSIYNVAGAVNYASNNTCSSCKSVQQQMVNQSTFLSTSGVNTNSSSYTTANFIGGFVTPLPGGAAAKAETTVGKAIWAATKNMSAVENALYHFTKHGSDFPEIQNAKQYVEMSTEFFKNSNLLAKVRGNGEKLYYDAGENIFGVTSKNGVPKTVFKPDRGIEYWLDQK